MKHRGAYFYILIVLALAAVAGMILLLAPGAAPETAPVTLTSAPQPSPSAPASQSEGPGDSVLELRPDNVQTVVALLKRADSYSRTLTAQSFWNGGSAETEYDVLVRGDNVRVTVRDGSGVDKLILLRGAEKWIWYSDGSGVWHGPAAEGEADEWQSVPSYEDLLELPAEDILDALYTEYDGETAVCARYRSGALGYETVCYISDVSGLLIGAEIYDGAKLIYTLHSGPVDISTPDEAAFTPPEAGQ